MDADDLSLPERLEKQVRFLDANPEVGAVGAYAKVVDENLRPLGIMRPPTHHAAAVIHFYIGTPMFDSSVMFWRRLLNAGDPETRNIYQLVSLLGHSRFANIPEALYIYRKHTVSHSEKRTDDWLQIRTSQLDRLLGTDRQSSVTTLKQLHWRAKLSWSERRWVRRQLTHLLDSMIAADWAEPGDRPLMMAEVNQVLEETSPRIWQMLCHWRRQRLKGL